MPKQSHATNDENSIHRHRIAMEAGATRDQDIYRNHKTDSVEEDILKTADAINILSMEEVRVSDSSSKTRRTPQKDANSSQKSHFGHKKQYSTEQNSMMKKVRQATRGSSQQMLMQPAGASADIVRSGHMELSTLWASNDTEMGRQPIMVNVVNAPNNSTLQCGCENISCPFCNLIMSIEQTDPSVLQ